MRHAPARLVRGVLCAHLLHTLVAEHRGGTDSTMKRAQPHPPHTRGAFHRRLQPLYTEKHKVSCSGFLPNTSPMQHSCNHYNALCSNTYTSMQPLHYDLHPLVAEHRGTDSAPKRPQPHPPHTGGTFHFARKTQGFVLRLRSSPTQASCNIHAAITMRFAATPTHPCSHYTTICIHSLQNTEEEPIRPRNGRSRTRRTQEVPFIAACSHFTRKNTRFRAPPPPQHKSRATFM